MALRKIPTVGLATKEFIIQPYQADTTPATIGEFRFEGLGSAGESHFIFCVPEDFSSLTKAEIIVIPDATETIQWDINTEYGAVGELYTTNQQSAVDQTKSVTVNVIASLDISALLTSLVAGDWVAVNFQSDTSTINPIGMRIKYS